MNSCFISSRGNSFGTRLQGGPTATLCIQLAKKRREPFLRSKYDVQSKTYIQDKIGIINCPRENEVNGLEIER